MKVVAALFLVPFLLGRLGDAQMLQQGNECHIVTYIPFTDL